MDGMDGDGMVRQGERVVRYGAGCGYGKVRQVRGGWVVVWAEFELGCSGQGKGRRAGGQELESWELGELGGKSRGRDTERWRAAHSHALVLTRQRETFLARSFVRPWPKGCHGTTGGT